MEILSIIGIILIVAGLYYTAYMYIDYEDDYQSYIFLFVIILAGIAFSLLSTLDNSSKESNSNNFEKVQVIETNESINSNTVKYFINLELIQEVRYIPKESPLMGDHEGEAVIEILMTNGKSIIKSFSSKKEALDKYEEIKKHLKVIDF